MGNRPGGSALAYTPAQLDYVCAKFENRVARDGVRPHADGFAVHVVFPDCVPSSVLAQLPSRALGIRDVSLHAEEGEEDEDDENEKRDVLVRVYTSGGGATALAAANAAQRVARNKGTPRQHTFKNSPEVLAHHAAGVDILGLKLVRSLPINGRLAIEYAVLADKHGFVLSADLAGGNGIVPGDLVDVEAAARDFAGEVFVVSRGGGVLCVRVRCRVAPPVQDRDRKRKRADGVSGFVPKKNGSGGV